MQKKSLINTLKTTKKANVAASPATNEGTVTRKAPAKKATIARGKSARYRKLDDFKM